MKFIVVKEVKMSKQTATEWLFKMLWDEPKDKLNWHAILNTAIEMERQQIEDAWYAGDEDGAIHEFEYYYNEKYGKP
jgi:hypothetical protein